MATQEESSSPRSEQDQKQEQEQKQQEEEKPPLSERFHHFCFDVILPIRKPHFVLLLVQLIACFNSIFTYSALAEEEVELSPLTLAVLRSSIALVCVSIVRYFYFNSLRRKQEQEKEEASKAAFELARRQVEEMDLQNNNQQQEQDQQNQQQSSQKQEQDGGEVVRIPASTLGASSSSAASFASPFYVVTAESLFAIARHGEKLAPKPRLDVMDRIKISLLGCIVIAGHLLSYYYGLWLLDDPTTFSALQSLVPTFCFIFGLAFHLDTFSAAKCIAIFFVLAGNLMLAHIDRNFRGEYNDVLGGPPRYTFNNRKNTEPYLYIWGAVLSLVASVCFAIYLVSQRPLAGRVSFADFLFYLYLAGTAGLLVASLVPEKNIVTSQILGGKLSTKSWLTALYAGGAHATFDYFFLAYATNRCGSSLVAALMNGLQPTLQVAVNGVIYGDSKRANPLDGMQIIGIVTVVWGIYCAIHATRHQFVK